MNSTEAINIGNDNGIDAVFFATGKDASGHAVRIRIFSNSLGGAAQLAKACGYTLESIE